LKDSCQLSGALNPELNAVGLAYALDTYLPKPLVRKIGSFGAREMSSKRIRRVGKQLPYLSGDILKKISKMSADELKRLSNAAEAINDNLITSTPEVVRQLRALPEYQKLMRWCYSLGVLNSDRVVKEWKKFSTLLRWKALRSETETPEIPVDFPGFGTERDNLSELPPLWRKLCPWLVRVWDRGCETKAESTRLLHLVTSRNFPAGSKGTREASLRQHAETLTSRFPTTKARAGILQRLSYFTGRLVADLKPKNFRSLGHLSLTSSASIDSPVKEGGRAAEVSVKFRTWATFVPDHDFEAETWFGEKYLLVAGRPRWQTMCRESPVHEPHHEFGESAENMNLDFENFKLEDPLYGLDEATGK
jgi:hypothetical protein